MVIERPLTDQPEPAAGPASPGALSPSARIKILMLKRGERAADVARAIGLSLPYTYQLLSGHVVSAKGRRAVERHFGVPVWGEAAQSEGEKAA